MKRYGIIGGTFDPIHYAHLYIAYEAKEQLNLDEVIFMPAGTQPLKKGKKVTESRFRYDMVKLAIEPFDKFSVSNYEIEKGGLSFTYETLEYFKSENSKFEFQRDCNINLSDKSDEDEKELFFITGADCLMNIEKWKEISKIFSLCTLAVFARGGYDSGELLEQKKKIEDKYNGNIVFLNLKELQISSTDIRERIINHKNVDFFVPEKVITFINEHDLYTK